MDYHIFDGMFPISMAESRRNIVVVISSLVISTLKMTLCKNLEIGHFFGHTLKGYKIVNTSRITLHCLV